ncbi:hypothetical protein JCM12294_47180 [Desulfocicer niacini]
MLDNLLMKELISSLNEDALPYTLTSFFLIIMSVLEWLRYFRNTDPSPKIVTLIAVIFTIYSVYKVLKTLRKIKSTKLGRDGERAVGQYLDDMRKKGYRIFHDVIGESFNLDHVIISRKGVYVIETKTYSKPSSGTPTIKFDGEKLVFKEYGTLTRPITQVNAASNWLKNLLLETTGKKYSIKPVILFPGWYVESTDKGRKSSVWVLNPKAFPHFLENQPGLLSKEDMMLASYHISRYIRTYKTA